LVRNVEHFVSRGAMDISGLGIKIVEQLIDEKLVRDVADLYLLKKEDLLKLEGFAEKKAQNLIEAIQQSRSQPLTRLITAIGIHGVGEVSARDLAAHFPSLDLLANATVDDLQTIDGVGPNIAEAIVDWFQRDRNRAVLVKLKSAGVWPVALPPSSVPGPSSAALAGMTFVVTGTLPTLNRDGVKEFIEQHGGKVTDSVSKKTSYLVLGEAPGSKYDKALSLGVKVIGEDELKKLCGE
jgi:DNA ligase (NAD+)